MRAPRGLLSLGLLLALLPGCSEPAEEPVAAAGGSPAFTLPAPDLAGLDEPVRRQLEEERDAVAQLAESPEVEPAGVAEAVGNLGRLYHAYDLLTAAETCYEEARRRLPEDPRWPYLLATLHRARGELDEAIEDYQAALAIRPRDLPTLLHLGEAELNRDRTEAAWERFEEALAAGGGAAAHYGLGRIAAERGEHKAAIEHLEKALELQPEAANLHYLLARSQRSLGNRAAAERHVALLGPGDVTFDDPLADELDYLRTGPGSHSFRGFQAFIASRYEEAVGHYRKAIAEDPDNVGDRRSLALVLIEMGDLAGGRKELEELIAIDPSYTLAYLDLGTTLMELGEMEGSLEHFRRALELQPDFKEAQLNLAVAQTRAGRWQEAEQAFARVLELDSRDRDARYYRAMALDQLGRSREAEAELARLLEQDPNHVLARQRLGALLARRGELAAAAEEHRVVLGIDSAPVQEKALAHFQLAQIAAQAGEPRQEIEHYERALALFPELWQARFNLGNALARRGAHREAALEYAAVVRNDPNNVLARVRQAEALAAAGDFAGARRRLEEGLAAMPASGELAHALARLLAAAPDPSVRDPRRAVELAGRLFNARRTLEHGETFALALAGIGRFDQAAEVQEALLNQAAERAPERVAELSGNLDRYRREQPGTVRW